MRYKWIFIPVFACFLTVLVGNGVHAVNRQKCNMFIADAVSADEPLILTHYPGRVFYPWVIYNLDGEYTWFDVNKISALDIGLQSDRGSIYYRSIGPYGRKIRMGFIKREYCGFSGLLPISQRWEGYFDPGTGSGFNFMDGPWEIYFESQSFTIVNYSRDESFTGQITGTWPWDQDLPPLSEEYYSFKYAPEANILFIVRCDLTPGTCQVWRYDIDSRSWSDFVLPGNFRLTDVNAAGTIIAATEITGRYSQVDYLNAKDGTLLKSVPNVFAVQTGDRWVASFSQPPGRSITVYIYDIKDSWKEHKVEINNLNGFTPLGHRYPQVVVFEP